MLVPETTTVDFKEKNNETKRKLYLFFHVCNTVTRGDSCKKREQYKIYHDEEPNYSGEK